MANDVEPLLLSLNLAHAGLLAGIPFLPAGKGALILILGGLAVLPFSLLWSRARAPPAPVLVGPRDAQWATGLQDVMTKAGVGPCRVLAVDAQRCIVSLASCGTCHRARLIQRRPHGCEAERRALQKGARPLVPAAVVREIACDPLGQGACTFEVRRGSAA